MLVLASLRTGIFTIECACPEPFRINCKHFGLPVFVSVWYSFASNIGSCLSALQKE
jgi:hypothetical protein